MELKQYLNLKMQQQLVMTPQLQQAIKLLQLSRPELLETVQQELVENPVLEEGHENPTLDNIPQVREQAPEPQPPASDGISNSSNNASHASSDKKSSITMCGYGTALVKESAWASASRDSRSMSRIRMSRKYQVPAPSAIGRFAAARSDLVCSL